ncbi:MAG: hypothetical protein WBO34_02035, partial [Gammaproteobacteria bacterium]
MQFLSARRTYPLLALVLLALFHANLPASTDGEIWAEGAKQTITRVREALANFETQASSPELLNEWLRELSTVRLQAQKCIDSEKDTLAKLNEQVDTAVSPD